MHFLNDYIKLPDYTILNFDVVFDLGFVYTCY